MSEPYRHRSHESREATGQEADQLHANAIDLLRRAQGVGSAWILLVSLPDADGGGGVTVSHLSARRMTTPDWVRVLIMHREWVDQTGGEATAELVRDTLISQYDDDDDDDDA